jgi:hypothetical protein
MILERRYLARPKRPDSSLKNGATWQRNQRNLLPPKDSMLLIQK